MADQVATATPEVKPTPQPDLITRASQVKLEQPKPAQEEKFNINDLDQAIEGVPDPKLKEQFVGLKKSLLRGENQKYQELAAIRKDYESKLNEFSTWTPERIQSLLQDQKFVEAAKSVIGPQQPEQTYKTETELRLEKEVADMKTRLQQLQGNSFEQMKRQEDEQLKAKYGQYYDPNSVDTIFNDMMQGKVQATREHLFKVVDYENFGKRCYELGKQDRQLELKEKIPSVAFAGDKTINVQPGDKPSPQQGESDRNYLQRLFYKNMEQRK